MKWVAGLLLFIAVPTACSDEAPTPVPVPRYISSFGKWGSEPGEFEYPNGIAVGPDSLLYVGDGGNARIQVFTSDGVFRREWPGVSEILVVAPDGTVCTAPSFRLTTDGREVYEGFRRNTNTGVLLDNWNGVQLVHGLQFDMDGNIYVYGRRVRDASAQRPNFEGRYFWKFNSHNELIKQWGYPGPRDTTGWIGGPMTWNARGNLLVLGSLDSAAVLFEFTPDGEPLSVRQLPGDIRTDDDIAVDRKGRIHVTSRDNARMYMLDPWGILLLEWSEVTVGKEPLDMPSGVAVDAAGFLYVVDWLRYRVVKYDPAP